MKIHIQDKRQLADFVTFRTSTTANEHTAHLIGMPHETGDDKGAESPPATPAFNDDAILLPLIVLTIIYGIVFSTSAVFVNSFPPQLWVQSPIITQITTDLVSRISNYIRVARLTSHPLDLPRMICYIPIAMYLGMNIILFSLLRPHRSTYMKTPWGWVPSAAMLLILGSCALTGMTFLEEILIVVPLTMSFVILPWYFGVYRARILGSKERHSAKS